MTVEQGILDLLDRVDQSLGEIDLGAIITPDAETRQQLRKVKIRVQNARLSVQEIRRRIERVGQETP